MKKIITAINNPKLNEELKKENNFEIIGKDILYKEAILEILEKNKNIDIVIISEQILGEINFEKLINKIKIINEKIKIIFILEKQNEELEKILIKNNIQDIYFNDEINLSELIKIINKKEINMQEEIIKLKKIIAEKNKNEKVNQEDIKNKKQFEELKEETKTEKIIKNEVIMSNKIITFSGNYKSGKTTLALIISQYLSMQNFKVLLIDADLQKQDLKFVLEKDFGVDINNKIKQNKNDNLKEKRYNFFNKKNKNYKIINKEYLKKLINLKNNKIKKENNFNKKNKLKKIKIKLNKIKNKLIKKEIKIKKLKNNNLENKNKKINYIKNKNKKEININKIKNNKKIKNEIINLEKNKNKINLIIKKINNNFYFLQDFNFFIKKSKRKNDENSEKNLRNLIDIIKENYEFIVFDLGKNNRWYINSEILKNSDINFVLMEANILGIKEIKDLLKVYKEVFKINENSLHIIENKSKKICVDTRLLTNILKVKNEIIKIKENKKYLFLLNNYLKRKKLLKNNNIIKDINKIIKIIKRKKE